MVLPVSRRAVTAGTRLIVTLGLAAGLTTQSAPEFAAAAYSDAPPPTPATLAELRADVTRTSDRLAAAAVAWERGQQRLNVLIQRKVSTGEESDQLQSDARAAQQRVSSLAASLYRNPVDPMLTAVLSGDTHAITDVTFVRRALGQASNDRRRDADLLNTRAAQSQSLITKQDAATQAATRLQASLDLQLARLQQDAQASVLRLQAAVELVRRTEAAAAAAAFGVGQTTGPGATCSGVVPPDALNGFLPISALCALKTAPGQRLIAPAAAAFDAMSSAFRAALGTPLCVTDSYRDYATQVQVFKTKPNLAATPGRSQHGLGRAVDLCGGIQSYGTLPYNWLKQNSLTYGFTHPDWAEPDGTRPEPWHWEYRG
jgi:D-alanyl-D-alanine carboxypeptidase